ncbi:8-amino-7-oxononanoate synthase [Anaerobacillus alkalidiazotrophicus]|uniref:8-amino-7-ketopelargonate synthase n=1 Tax=Anaerobacillus alkalidiazotrophicus TaxID=472963 RepID=A0A1S2LZW4_9BACI|nr:8-amino-7-oxononanoate synthase [Anaerobacillus alkalidiazotrophicus]OIJ17936.1 8-amino-7-oxononanoate synthase [Anaerobacillus alkalidiazotrophicus]
MTNQTQWETEIKAELEFLENIFQRRSIVTTKELNSSWLIRNGQKLLNLASNNYLGLLNDSRLKKAASKAIDKYGVGSGASRLMTGNHPLYDKVESRLIQWKRAEAALVLNSGYTANVGIISALMKRDDIVFSDKLNHASIIDGIVLSRAKLQRYRHRDTNHLEALLMKAPKDKRKLIVTDTVFSMDGDIADLEGIVRLKEKYNAMLMVDEAHASGVYGKGGQGYSHHVNLQDKVDIQVGTFSKALGSFGAYVVAKKWLIDYIINRMRGLIYSTALPPAVLATIEKAIEIVEEEREKRTLLLQHAEYFRNRLTRFGFDTCESESQIVPIIIGANSQTQSFATRLQEEGIAAIAVRPPTVPENKARIRFAITSAHQKKELDWALEKIIQVGKELEVI